MQTLLILSLLIAVWLNRETAPRRSFTDTKVVKSTGLARLFGVDAHRFRRWVEETHM